ncbi:hypothetical protein SSX86_004246 [Deinandra increscens subsp. villosa]|uniref:J domain-containing protein n=1 Tax=Deinandra increscens subsp. villosa TaxID=3103831 RepID=A0AAP0H8N3_9ASTR
MDEAEPRFLVSHHQTKLLSSRFIFFSPFSRQTSPNSLSLSLQLIHRITDGLLILTLPLPSPPMDYYKVLGLTRTASKDEIKEAFRNIAKKFHPDKHSASPKSVRDGATVRFKQASEAYEVLVDDHKRADYNLRSNRTNYGGSSSGSGSGYGNYGYGYTTRNNNNSSWNSDYYGSRKGSVSRVQIALGYINSRAFLLNVAFAGAILSGLAVVEIGRDTVWKMHNPGKSFEEAMESIQKTKSVKEKE